MPGARDPRSEEISSRSLGSLVNLGNTDERKEVEIASRKLVRPDSSSEVGYSQMSRQENVPIASRKLVREGQLQTNSDEREQSHSNSTRKFAASSPELRNTEYTNHQYMTKIFHFLQKKLGVTAGYSTFSIEAYKTNVLMCGMFMTSSMKAAIHLGPNYLSNSEIYKNTKFEKIESVFNITQKLVMEHSEEILIVKCLEHSSPSWARSEKADDQAIKWAKAKVCVHADTVLRVGQRETLQKQ